MINEATPVEAEREREAPLLAEPSSSGPGLQECQHVTNDCEMSLVTRFLKALVSLPAPLRKKRLSLQFGGKELQENWRLIVFQQRPKLCSFAQLPGLSNSNVSPKLPIV